MSRPRVLHLITRMIVAGAQENTLLSAAHLDRDRFDPAIWSGAQHGTEGTLVDACQERGIPLETVPDLVREVNPIRDLRALGDLTRRLRTARIDVLHTHSSKAGILGRIAARRAGVPVVVHTVHGWSFHDRMSAVKRRSYIALERWTAGFTDTLITVTGRDTDKGLRAGIGRPDQYVTIHSGIELDRFTTPAREPVAVRGELGIPEDAVVIGCVGRLSAQKNPLAFVELASRIHGDHPETRFLWVGDGPLRRAVEDRVRGAGLDGIVVLTGVRHDVPELTHAMDVFVLPSLWEGLPRVFPQAMAAGKPIVATRVDGAPEAIEHGETGFLVEADDLEGLTAFTRRLVENPELRTRLGEAGRRRVDPDFCARDMARRITAVYDRLLEHPRS